MKKLIIYIATILFVSLFSNCQDEFLDRGPIVSPTTENFYKTEDDAMQGLVAIYGALQLQVGFKNSWAPFLVASDILSDDCYAGGENSSDGLFWQEFNTFNITSTNINVETLWDKNYRGIYTANLLISKLPDIENTTDEFTGLLESEAKFFRAYFHFELVRFFENVPLITTVVNDTEAISIPAAAPSETYNQIAKDLIEAIEVLPESLHGDNDGRVTKWSAIGLLARIYLFYNGVYENDFNVDGNTVGRNQIVSYLDDLIQNSGHTLLANYDGIFRLENEYSTESVFEISHGDASTWGDCDYIRGTQGNLAAQMQGPRAGTAEFNRGWSFAPVSQKLVDALDGDPRQNATILFESEINAPNLGIGYQHTGYFSQKYTSDAEHWGEDGSLELNRKANFRVIRYADILLMHAELTVDNQAGLQHYRDVRARAGLDVSNVNSYTLEDIMLERRLELSLEGSRYFDLMRQGITTMQTELNSTIVGSTYAGSESEYQVSFNASTKGFLPIPQIELDLSQVLNQNDGY